MRIRHIQLSAIVVCLVLSASAVASPTFSQLPIPNVADVGGNPTSDLFVEASIRGTEDRITWEQWAKQEGTTVAALKKNYPVNAFVCGKDLSEVSTSVLVGSNNVVGIAGHSIYDENCNLIEEAKDCYIYRGEGQYSKLNLEFFVSGAEIRKAEGRECRFQKKFNSTEFTPDDRLHDWMFVRLDKPIKDAKPFKLRKFQRQAEETPLSLVSAAADNFGKGRGKDRSYQSCSRKEIMYGANGEQLWKTNCDTGGMMSFSPMIGADRNVYAFHVASINGADGAEYDPTTNYGVPIAVTDEMIEAVEVLSGRKKPAQSTVTVSSIKRKTKAKPVTPTPSAQPQEAVSTQPTTKPASTNDISEQPNSAICSRALNAEQTAFDDRGFYNAEIEEAQRRGFDVEKCKAVVNLIKLLPPRAQSEETMPPADVTEGFEFKF